jgi:imidazolonepropionase-like amidohydrolase
MTPRALLAIVTSMWVAAGPARAADELLFRGARIFDGTALVTGDVWVANGVIKAVGPNLRAPHATVVDGKGKTLLPGLIDAHSHAYEDKALKQALVFGVTTELEMFGDPEKNTALRKREQAGEPTGQADLRSAGVLATAPGGHGTEYGIPIPTLSRPDEAEAFVRGRIDEGSDYLKIVVEPGFKKRPVPTLNIDTTRALIEAAHRHHLLAVVHISRQADARAVVEAGADGLVHVFVDEEPAADFAATVKARRAFVIPTLAVNCGFTSDRWAKALAEDLRLAPFLDEQDLTQLLHVKFPTTDGSSKVCDNAEHAVAQLYRSQVPLLAGTDALNPRVVHGASLHGELALLVEAGLSAKDALIAATSAPAKQFHLDDRGRIAPGLRADLLLVEGDPTTDIRQTRAIVGVWKRGIAVDRAGYRAGIDKQREEAARMRNEAPPAGSESGSIATFESGKLDAGFGAGWSLSTDALRGGKSTAKLDVIAGGAKTRSWGLRVSGEIRDGFQFPWAGAMFSPGPAPMATANLSKKKTLSFYAKGDGRTYRVMLFARQLGFTPAVRTFVAGPEWTRVTFAFSDFGVDGRDVMGILWTGGPETGAFSFRVDDLSLE